jgi:hypothetical protein
MSNSQEGFFPEGPESSQDVVNTAFELLNNVDIQPTTFYSSTSIPLVPSSRPIIAPRSRITGSSSQPPSHTSTNSFFQQTNSRRSREESAGNQEPELPVAKRSRTQPPTPTGIHPPLQSRPHKSIPLPPTNAYIFKKHLFERHIIPEDNSNMRVTCTQPNCDYDQVYARKIEGTGNFTRHYAAKHPEIPYSEKTERAQKGTDSKALKGFFTPRETKQSFESRDDKFKTLLLSFFVKNNLSFRVVDQQSFKDLIEHLCELKLPSSRTLVRRLKKTFEKARSELKVELLIHVQSGGRISLTLDCWGARNLKDFMAITAHWINEKWEHKSCILDVIYMEDPVHSGVYMCDLLAKVTEEFGITSSIFTITRDNASPNNVMLDEFEAIVADKWDAMCHEDQARFQLKFTRKNGDIRCLCHVVNIGVQAGKLYPSS